MPKSRNSSGFRLLILVLFLVVSLLSVLAQFAKYEDNFVGEGLNLNFEKMGTENIATRKGVRRINRRDAARAVVEAISSLDAGLQGKTVQVWTDQLK